MVASRFLALSAGVSWGVFGISFQRSHITLTIPINHHQAEKGVFSTLENTFLLSCLNSSPILTSRNSVFKEEIEMKT
jgi:hypothetical protein